MAFSLLVLDPERNLFLIRIDLDHIKQRLSMQEQGAVHG
jgi:hypothetical protein